MFISTLENFMSKNVTIVVPHGDDEALGFGGIIQKHVQNEDNVNIIFCRRPIDARTQQQFSDIIRSQAILEFDTYTGLDMSDGKVVWTNEGFVFWKTK